MNPTTAQVPLIWGVATYSSRIVVGATVLSTDTFAVAQTSAKYLRC
jgi:hypothetical protein